MAQTSVLTTTRIIKRGMINQGMLGHNLRDRILIGFLFAGAVVPLSLSISWPSPVPATRYEACSTLLFTALEPRSTSPLSSQIYLLTSRGETPETWTRGSGTTPAQNTRNMMINIIQNTLTTIWLYLKTYLIFKPCDRMIFSTRYDFYLILINCSTIIVTNLYNFQTHKRKTANIPTICESRQNLGQHLLVSSVSNISSKFIIKLELRNELLAVVLSVVT